MKRIKVLLVFLFGIILLSLSIKELPSLGPWEILETGKEVVKTVKGIPVKEENNLGREIAANIIARWGLYRNENLTHYLNLVGQVMARNATRKEVIYHFGILDTDFINAFACPGGYVFVTKGLFFSVRNEAELAGVLAHEIAHIERRHILKEIEKSELLGTGVGLATQLSKDKNNELLKQATNLGTDLLFKGLSCKDELEADSLATENLAQIRYEASSLESFLHFLSQLKKEDEGKLALLFRSHPSLEERIKNISEYRKKNEIDSTGILLTERLKKIKQ